MSTTPPPDRPTERLRPATAPPPPPVAYDRVVEPVAPVAGGPVATDPTYLFARLEDSISSLRTALAFVAVLAVAALGVALYALLKNDVTDRTTGGGTSARITRLDDRIDRLSRQVQGIRAGGNSPAALAARVDSLSRSVSALRTQAGSTSAAPDPTKALQDLSSRIDAVDQKVQDLSTQTPATP